MKFTSQLFFFIFISGILLIFSSGKCIQETSSEHQQENPEEYSIVVNFEYGEDLPSTAYKNIYAVWLENTQENLIQNISICQKLVKGGVTGIALPYWKLNKYPSSSSVEIDAVTSATLANQDFSVSAELKDSSIREFVLYFEVDRSFEPNDWFNDQPALLYSTTINLDNTENNYELIPTGWTPNDETQNVIPNTITGQLQEEMRYITHHKVGNEFGTIDERSATKMVKKITVQIIPPTATGINEINSEPSLSMFPNPTTGKVNIKSKYIIDDVLICNLQGEKILRDQPKTRETTITLKKKTTPVGSYIVNVTTSNGIKTSHVLLVE